MKKIKVQHNGAEIEVELPDGWLSPEEAVQYQPGGSIFQAAVSQALPAAIQTGGFVKPDTLLTDEAFKVKAVAAWKLQNPGKGEPSGAELEKMRLEWETTVLKPVQDKADAAEKRAATLLKRANVAALVDAARPYVKDEFLAVPANAPADAVPPIVAMFGGFFGNHPETDALLLRNGETFAFSTKPTQDNPYKGAGEWFETWAGDKANAAFLKDPAQRGPGLGNVNGGGAGGTIVLSRADASDHSKYQAAVAQAKTSGATVTVADA